MKSGIMGQVVSLLIAIMMLVVSPIYYIGIVEWTKTSHAVLSDMRNLTDEVIDTRKLTDDMLADFNLGLAGQSSYLQATILREVKVINPDPANPGKTYTTYMVTDDISTYNQGDMFTVRVETVGMNIFQVISRSMLGLTIRDDGFTLTGRVR